MEIAARIEQKPAPWAGFNGPGAIVRATKRAPGVLPGRAGPALFSWGPPPPPSFINPEDLADMMASAHPAG